MIPYLTDHDLALYVGDCRKVLSELPDQSVHCVVTSPPYWGLRDYGTGKWEGGDPNCEHKVGTQRWQTKHPNGEQYPEGMRPGANAWECFLCGAVRVDEQLGLEQTPQEYVANMVEVFREVRRVLRDDGTLWLNIGDSYAPDHAQTRAKADEFGRSLNTGLHANVPGSKASELRGTPAGLKPKDLVGIPWMVAKALQVDGWCLRSDTIWAKPNPMTESVKDRPTKAHEYVFMFSKAPWRGRNPGPIEGRLSDNDAKWLALLLDTEGNICVKRVAPVGENSPQYGAQIAVGSTSRDLIEQAQLLVGAGNILERSGTNAPMYYWQVSNKVAQDLLYALYPHLIVKQRQARIAIHLESLLYHRGNATKRTDAENTALESLWQRNKMCNQFGEPDLSDVPEPKYGKWGTSRYFYDYRAIAEPAKDTDLGVLRSKKAADGQGPTDRAGIEKRLEAGVISRNGNPSGLRNVRSVWTFNTPAYSEAHFATFPEELPSRCIRAGTSEHGCCPLCGAPWVRESIKANAPHRCKPGCPCGKEPSWQGAYGDFGDFVDLTQFTGQWLPSCDHGLHPVPCTVLDPFAGAGTTAKVARGLGRRTVLIELSEEFAQLISNRTRQLSLLT